MIKRKQYELDSFLKGFLISKITQELSNKRLTQIECMKITGISQPKISRLFNNNSYGFSIFKLYTILNRLGYDINIQIKISKNNIGKISII